MYVRNPASKTFLIFSNVFKLTVVEELYKPFTTIVNEMLKLRAKLEHCMVVDLLIVDGLVTVVLKCFKSVLQVYFFSVFKFCFEM